MSNDPSGPWAKVFEIIIGVAKPNHLLIALMVTAGSVVFDPLGVIKRLAVTPDGNSLRFWVFCTFEFLLILVGLKTLAEIWQDLKILWKKLCSWLVDRSVVLNLEERVILAKLAAQQPDSISLLRCRVPDDYAVI